MIGRGIKTFPLKFACQTFLCLFFAFNGVLRPASLSIG
jgi:hypothetical protein